MYFAVILFLSICSRLVIFAGQLATDVFLFSLWGDIYNCASLISGEGIRGAAVRSLYEARLYHD